MEDSSGTNVTEDALELGRYPEVVRSGSVVPMGDDRLTDAGDVPVFRPVQCSRFCEG